MNVTMKEGYQGWTNCKTWCVALTLNNTQELQKKAILCSMDGEVALKKLCKENWGKIVLMARWAWGATYDEGSVDWQQVVEHFKEKVGSL